MPEHFRVSPEAFRGLVVKLHAFLSSRQIYMIRPDVPVLLTSEKDLLVMLY
jgi:hypothetical protein